MQGLTPAGGWLGSASTWRAQQLLTSLLLMQTCAPGIWGPPIQEAWVADAHRYAQPSTPADLNHSNLSPERSRSWSYPWPYAGSRCSVWAQRHRPATAAGLCSRDSACCVGRRSWSHGECLLITHSSTCLVQAYGGLQEHSMHVGHAAMPTSLAI